MDWETPTYTEIKMDAELSSYVDDLRLELPVPSPAPAD
jgi:hypothetical protein